MRLMRASVGDVEPAAKGMRSPKRRSLDLLNSRQHHQADANGAVGGLHQIAI
jgi:hypothetical protein